MRQLWILPLIVLFAYGSACAEGEYVTYKIDSKDYEGYFTRGGADAPLVVLLHDWDGLTDYEVQRAEMLAKEGYAVFAADLFGKGIRPTEVVDKKQHTGELYKDRAKMRALVQAAVDNAAELGADTDRAVTMGYCFGGAAVLEYARSGAAMKGFVTFHGGLATPEGQDYSATKAKILVLHGTADSNITMNDFADLASELEMQGVPHEMVTYSGAPHAFTVFGSDRYREDADKKSWQRFMDFLRETLR